MTIEVFKKSKEGPAYYCVYYGFGQVSVSVTNIKAKDKEAAIAAAAKYLQKALEEK